MNNGWSNLTIQSVSRIFLKKNFLFHPLGGKQEGKTVWPFEKSKGFPLFPLFPLLHLFVVIFFFIGE